MNYQGALAACYLRVSTAEQQNSIDMQTTQIANYAKFKGLTLSKEVTFEDSDTSGMVPIFNRESGAKMLNALKKKKVKHLIVLKLDRLGRNAVDIQTSYQMLTKKMGITVHIVDLGGDSFTSDSSVTKVFIGLLSIFAEFEVDNTRSRINNVFAEKYSKREQIGAVPFGWKSVETERRTKRDKVLKLVVPDENEMAHLKRIIELKVVHRKTLQEICDILNREGIKTKRAGTKFERNGKVITASGLWDKSNLGHLLKSRHVVDLIEKTYPSKILGVNNNE